MLRFLYSLRLLNNNFKPKTKTDKWQLLQGAPLDFYWHSKRFETLISPTISVERVNDSKIFQSFTFVDWKCFESLSFYQYYGRKKDFKVFFQKSHL